VFVISLIEALIHCHRRDGGELGLSDHLVRKSLEILQNLVSNGSLPPSDFVESFGWFVNEEMQVGTPTLQELSCQLWTIAIERGDTGAGILINDLLGLVQSPSRAVRQRALALFVALLEQSPRASDFIHELFECNGVGNFLNARRHDFECLSSCAKCLRRIFAGATAVEMEVLMCSDVMAALVEVLSLEEEELVLFGLRAMADLFEFAIGHGTEKEFRDLLADFLQANGPELIIELKTTSPNPEIRQVAETMLTVVQVE
jgi:hypothetical protein